MYQLRNETVFDTVNKEKNLLKSDNILIQKF